jgi:hypothetical protein
MVFLIRDANYHAKIEIIICNICLLVVSTLTRSTFFLIGFGNCSDSVIFCYFHFIDMILQYKLLPHNVTKRLDTINRLNAGAIMFRH